MKKFAQEILQQRFRSENITHLAQIFTATKVLLRATILIDEQAFVDTLLLRINYVEFKSNSIVIYFSDPEELHDFLYLCIEENGDHLMYTLKHRIQDSLFDVSQCEFY